MTRRVKTGIAVAVAVAITVVAAWLAVGRGGGVQAERPTTPPPVAASHMASATPSPQATKTVLTADEAVKLASDLVSADTTSYRSAWYDATAMPPKAPAGTKLTIDDGTFQSQANAGKVNAVVTLPGKPPEVWRLLLLRKDDRWTVYTMEEVK